MIIGLCGHVGAGKGAVAHYLHSKGWSHYAITDVIREELERHGIPATRETMIAMANLLREQHGPGVLAERVVRRLSNGNTVVESIRNPEEVRVLRQRKDFVLVAVDAPVEMRFARSKQLAKPGDPKTFDEFLALDQRESHDPNRSGVRIKECCAMADRTIVNDGDMKKLHADLDSMLAWLGTQ
jgi:dephospho-CoA kinase